MSFLISECRGIVKLPNKRLELAMPDAAQSVAGAPPCLLSGLAAQAHVVWAERYLQIKKV